MAVLTAIVAAAVLAWIDYRILRNAKKHGISRMWTGVFICLLLSGIVVGVMLGCCFEYQISERMRVASFPVPAGFLVLEGDTWVGFVTPTPGFIAFLNVIITILAFLIPLSLGGLITSDSNGGHTGEE